MLLLVLKHSGLSTVLEAECVVGRSSTALPGRSVGEGGEDEVGFLLTEGESESDDVEEARVRPNGFFLRGGMTPSACAALAVNWATGSL